MGWKSDDFLYNLRKIPFFDLTNRFLLRLIGVCTELPEHTVVSAQRFLPFEARLATKPDANDCSDLASTKPSIRSLFETEETGLLRFAFSLTGRRAVAEEIVQEVFLQLHAKWDSVNDPRPWLYRCVRNNAFQHLRKSRRESQPTEDQYELLIDDTNKTPDDLIAHMEIIATLRGLVAELPEKDQRIIQLKYFEGLKYRDISKSTGLTVSNVGFRLHQILKTLASGLLPKGNQDEP